MTKQTAKKLTAWLLSISMVLSMVVDVLPAAFAAGESGSTPVFTDTQSSDGDKTSTTGRPTLYVDYLGDNKGYIGGSAGSGALAGLNLPATVDQNANTNPNAKKANGADVDWKGYRQADTTGKDVIFWVGVGIDNMSIWDLFHQSDEGVYSLELGFYYDSNIIQPYIPASTYTYQDVIKAANSGYWNNWTDYTLIEAQSGLDTQLKLKPQTDWVTQDTMTKPSMNEIMTDSVFAVSNNQDWRMTYISLERTAGTENRLKGVYGTTDATGTETQYLLVVPFRLVGYDSNYDPSVADSAKNVCLRLIRNAGLFSISGDTDGAKTYGAWERTTVRNEGRDLKLMTNFAGDLDIFGGVRRPDENYAARLTIQDAGGRGNGNAAELSVTNDPSTVNQVKVSNSGDSITGLSGGTGMTVNVTLMEGYYVRVLVYYKDKDSTIYPYGCSAWAEDPKQSTWSEQDWTDHGWISDQRNLTYSFVMPDHNVTVEVRFEIKNTTKYWLFLDEDPDPADAETKVKGNETQLDAVYTKPSDSSQITSHVDKGTPKNTYVGLPAAEVHVVDQYVMGESGEVPNPDYAPTEVTVTVNLHHDYIARVQVINDSTQMRLAVASDKTDVTSQPVTITDENGAPKEAGNQYIVPTDGTTLTFNMPRNSVTVRVEYEKATQHTVTLKVDDGTAPSPKNVAQLETTTYNNDDEPLDTYTGVVYHKLGETDPNSVLETDPTFRILEKVETAAAPLSGSLGGDRTPLDWSGSAGSIMALLRGAYDAAATVYTADNTVNMETVFTNTLKASLTAHDLRSLEILEKGAGLRKNTGGDLYAESDMTALYPVLYALAVEIETNSTTAKATGGTSPDQYDYYDLTTAQLQAWVLDYAADSLSAALKTDADARTALAAYAGTWHTHEATPTASLKLRSGREVWVVVEPASDTTVATESGAPSVIVYKPNKTTIPDAEKVAVTKVEGYQNVYSFEMPDYDCEVWVTYEKRTVHDLSLSIESKNGASDDNKVAVTGYKGVATGPAAVAATITENGDEIKSVLAGSTVTVEVKVASGYKATAVPYNKSNGIAIGTGVSDQTGDFKFTFTMPADCDVEVRVIYENTNLTPHDAHFVEPVYYGGSTPGSNRLEWVKNGTPSGDMDYPNVVRDTPLVGQITVAPGYYIRSVRAYTEYGTGSFVLSGNGWNNGEGGVVRLDTLMPDAEYWIEVTFAKADENGPPPEEPDQPLTLRVVDDKNTSDTTPPAYADNWAKLTTQDPSGSAVTLGEVGKTKTSMAASTGNVAPGETVRVDFEAVAGYYVKSVEVVPSSLGVSLDWKADVDTSGSDPVYTPYVEFVMPAGGATVVVTFDKVPADLHLYLNLAKTERSGDSETTNRSNTITTFTSPAMAAAGLTDGKYTVDGTVSGAEVLPVRVPTVDQTSVTTAALPGQRVTLDINVAAGWYIDSITVRSDTGRLSYTLSDNGYNGGSGGTAEAAFIMPNSDVWFTVHYRKGDPATDDHTDHILELVVSDPDNTTDAAAPAPADYADNWAKATISGVNTGTIGELGKGTTGNGTLSGMKYAKAGDTVTIDYKTADGYTLDAVIVTPAGYHVVPVYSGSKQLQFTMPDGDATALVRFRKLKDGETNKYTVNLVLYMPNGTALADYDTVGIGTLVTTGSDLEDKTKRVYSMEVEPGNLVEFLAKAMDGYYIEKATVTSAALGITPSLSGAFGRQEGSFVMPTANAQVNVFFKRAWPDEVKYAMTLRVYDSSGLTGSDGKGSYANFESVAGTDLSAPNSDPVYGGESKTLWNMAADDDRVVVALERVTGAYVRRVSVTDDRGRTIPWSYTVTASGGLGIAYEATPGHVYVDVSYAKRTDTEHEKHSTLTLHVHSASGDDAASLAGTDTTPATFTLTTEGASKTVAGGEILTLKVTPDAARSVQAVYTVSPSGQQLILPMTPVPVPGGGEVKFVMPDENVDVFVVFSANRSGPNDLTATLIVAGPHGALTGDTQAWTSGTATLTEGGGSATTGAVAAAGASSLFAPQDTVMTVDLAPESGYSIAVIRVTDRSGNRVEYTWTGAKQFTFPMPGNGVQVYVEYEKESTATDLTAQIVVNDGSTTGTATGNDAKLIKHADNTTGATGYDRLTALKVNDQIDVLVTLQPGYRVEYIKVVPAKYGIVPTVLPGGDDPTFFMPGESVVVYVKFVRDTRTRLTATLYATGEAADGNKAWISSDVSGQQGPAVPPSGTATVQAAPPESPLAAEWVTVDYEWDATSAVKQITVVRAGTSISVPFTQTVDDKTNRKGQITFPMVNDDVTVTVEYQKDTDDVLKYPVVLHVIDLDAPAETETNNWGEVFLTSGAVTGIGYNGTGQIKAKASPGGNNESAPLQVPAGESVKVRAEIKEAGYYIQAAYVLYEAGGQMIQFPDNKDGVNISPAVTATTDHATFTMHPCRADVYIYFTKTPPVATDYSAVLMLESAAGDTGADASTASITNDSATGNQKATATVTAKETNMVVDYVTATKDNKITVKVTPQAGYRIESVLMTPLGVAVDGNLGSSFDMTLIERDDATNTYTFSFTMPNQNVAVRVRLEASSRKQPWATLHYQQVTLNSDGTAVVTVQDVADATKDWASLTYTEDSGIRITWKNHLGKRKVTEGSAVTLGVSMDSPNVVLAAYVLNGDGELVALNPGLEGTEEGASYLKNTVTDAEAIFTMPSTDVDVFVWFVDKNQMKVTDWYTAVLTVTDTDGTDENKGDNSAELRSTRNTTPVTVPSTGVPGHQFLWVEKGETVTVDVKSPASGYDYSPESKSFTHSPTPASPPTLNEVGSTATGYIYTYTYEVGEHNSALKLHFVGSNVVQSPLNVKLVDPDNPGNGTVTNAVTVTPESMAALSVNSISSAGARQQIPNVPVNRSINYTVTPADGYSYVVRLITTDSVQVLTSSPFTMPDKAATLEVTFFKARKAVLELVETNAAQATETAAVSGGADPNQAQMTESSFGGKRENVELSTALADRTFDALPDNTVLAASMTNQVTGTHLVGAVAETDTGAAWIAKTTVTDSHDEYRHTIAGSDVTVKMLVADDTETAYVATVTTVNRPDGTSLPGIANSINTLPNGSVWTMAYDADSITVSVPVPAGYKVVITADGGGSAVSLTDSSTTDTSLDLTTSDTVTFTIPASNVYVTVKYVKTAFTATITTAGTGSGTADLSDGANTITSVLTNGIITTAAGNLTGLNGTETMPVTATPDADNTLAAVTVRQEHTGTTTYISMTESSGEYSGSFAMPQDDVTVTVIFNAEPGEDEKTKHVAYVTTTGDIDDLPANSAQSIRDLTDTTMTYGDIWTYAVDGDQLRVNFTTAPGYTAVVTAKYAGGTTVVSVIQQGTTGSCTVALTMPDADVEVIITYYGPGTAPTPTTHNLYLRLVGHDEISANAASLTGGAAALSLTPTTGDGTAPLWSTAATTAKLGDALDLSATRDSKYKFLKATIEVVTDTATTPPTVASGETVLNVNEYGLTGVALGSMPDADVVVTVYFQLNSKDSPRPFDPEHSTRYNAASYPSDATVSKGRNQLKDKDQAGWILATDVDTDNKTFVVTVPTLYDSTAGKSDSDALENADIGTTAKNLNMVYKLYWWNDTLATPDYEELVVDDGTNTATTDIEFVTSDTKDLAEADNPKGDYPKDGTGIALAQHMGRQLTVKVLDTSASPLATYLESGGLIYITATRDGEYADGVPWAESEKVQVVLPSNGLRPYDPKREPDTDDYSDHWIRAENRGDYLIVTVPTLADGGNSLNDVNGNTHTFSLYLQTDVSKKTVDAVDVTSLLEITNVDKYFEEDWTAPTPADTDYYIHAGEYKTDTYYTDSAATPAKDYTGARFMVTIKSDATGTNVDALKVIFNNDGTMNAKAAAQYRMYISVTETPLGTDINGKSEGDADYIPTPGSASTAVVGPLVDFEVPQFYTLQGRFQSYAPTHKATFNLYPMVIPESTDLDYAAYTADPTAYADDADHYETDPALTHIEVRETGTDLWTLDFAIKSSSLVGDTPSTGVTYKLTIEKAGHVTFTWLNLELKAGNLDPVESEWYTATGAASTDAVPLTFTVVNVDEVTGDPDWTGPTGGDKTVEMGLISLIGGDVDGDGYVHMADQSILKKFQNGRLSYSTDKLKSDTDWATSVYNPQTLAYKADLNGDGWVDTIDIGIWNTPRNFNKNVSDYNYKTLKLRTETMMNALKVLELTDEEPLNLEGMTMEELEAMLLDDDLELSDQDRETIEAKLEELRAELPEEAAEEVSEEQTEELEGAEELNQDMPDEEELEGEGHAGEASEEAPEEPFEEKEELVASGEEERLETPEEETSETPEETPEDIENASSVNNENFESSSEDGNGEVTVETLAEEIADPLPEPLPESGRAT